MGMSYKNVGGSGTGIGGDFASWLQQGLMGGHFGGSAANNGISGVFNDILGGGAGTIGGALQSILSNQQTNDVNSIRSRYGVGGGTGFGTPAAYGEASYRAQAAPQITSALGNLQLNAINSIMPYIGSMAGRDTPQAQTVGQQNPFVQAAGLAIPLISSMASGGAFNQSGGMSPMTIAGSGNPGGFSFSPSMGNPFQNAGYTPFQANYGSMNGFNPNIPNPFFH